MRSDEETDRDGDEGSEPTPDGATDGTPGNDESPGAAEGEAEEADEPDVYEDLPDGCGCAEMWERTSERRGTD